MRLVPVVVLLWCLLVLTACQRHDDAQATARAASSGRPDAVATATLLHGRVICPLESANGTPFRESRELRAGSKETLVGWSRSADPAPTGPLRYVVFRSVVPDGSQDVFWRGQRVPRPDLAAADPALADAGYAASGTITATPGRYRVLVWMGDATTQRECDTGEVIVVH